MHENYDLIHTEQSEHSTCMPEMVMSMCSVYLCVVSNHGYPTRKGVVRHCLASLLYHQHKSGGILQGRRAGRSSTQAYNHQSAN